jgi:hypothetical protein
MADISCVVKHELQLQKMFCVGEVMEPILYTHTKQDSTVGGVRQK